ncbi:MAG: hypothetical protein ABSF95_22835 [Verrucomicrobiota bacterium]|jgi:hypothetical protein
MNDWIARGGGGAAPTDYANLPSAWPAALARARAIPWMRLFLRTALWPA